MATSLPVAGAASALPSSLPLASGSAKSPVKFVLLWMLIGAAITFLGFGGALYYFMRSGRLLLRGSTAIEKTAPVEFETHLLVLDPLLVNLSDEGGSAYLRLSMSLQVADAEEKKDSRGKDGKSDDAVAAVRDTALTVLGRETASDLLAVQGKEHLKVELKDALAKNNVDLRVKKIFFTDFLVQR